VSPPHIIDAHVHLEPNSRFYTPRPGLMDLLPLMDRLGIQYAVCTDHLSLYAGAGKGLDRLRKIFELSRGRIYYLGVYDPRKPSECLKAIKEALNWPGFAGIKIHPSFHGVAAEAPTYRAVWELAAEHSLAVLTHSWSVSPYNTAQKYSTPERFERYIDEFKNVRLILAHAGGRGTGRNEALRLLNTYENVYTDIAGDIYCRRLIESLVRFASPDKILFGSDFPWLDPRSNLARVFLAEVPDDAKEKILRNNALKVYRMEESGKQFP
jgi:predicted TIM-barrel fold metal-dependent hydrolase